MENGHFRGTPRPGKARPRIPVVRVLTVEAHQFCIISRAIYGQNIHWHANRSHECKKDRGTCKACIDSWPEKWKGYLHCIDMTRVEREEVFLEFTDTAAGLLVASVPPGEDLRGLSIRVSKTKGGAKGRYLIAVLDRRTPDENLPAEKDPLDTLRFLWQCKNQHVQEA